MGRARGLTRTTPTLRSTTRSWTRSTQIASSTGRKANALLSFTRDLNDIEMPSNRHSLATKWRRNHPQEELVFFSSVFLFVRLRFFFSSFSCFCFSFLFFFFSFVPLFYFAFFFFFLFSPFFCLFFSFFLLFFFRFCSYFFFFSLLTFYLFCFFLFSLTCEDGPNLWSAMTRMKLVSCLISNGL